MKILIAISSPHYAPPMLAAARMLAQAGHPVRVLDSAPARSGADLADAIAPQFAALQAALAPFAAELLLADAGFAGVLPLLLGARRQRPAVALFGLRPWDGAAAAAGGGAQLAQARANAVLARLGAAPLPMPLAEAMLALPDRYLQLGVPAFEHRVMCVPDNFVFVGALAGPARPAPAQPLPGQPLVLLAPGGDRPQPPAALGAALRRGLGPQARVAELDRRQYAALLPRAALAVTPGCLNTVLAALRAGVPVLCVGADAAALAIGERLAASGAGIGLPSAAPGVRALRHAAGALLALPRFRRAAAALSIEFDDFQAERMLAALCRQPAPPAAAPSALTLCRA